MTTGKTSTQALAEAATTAGAAPSIHNTQPWRWRVHPDRMDLYAQRDRQLAETDPEGRMLTISCGTALHHARVALAAEGWEAAVSRLPDPDDPDLLAQITLGERTTAAPEAKRLFDAVRLRHTDRRPVTGEKVASETLGTFTRVAAEQGVQLEVLREEQVDDLVVAVRNAAIVDADDPEIQDELRRWTGGWRGAGSGIPDASIPAEPLQTEVAGRTFARPGMVPVGGDEDRGATYAILYGDNDDPAAWLPAGEALSAVWLTAAELDVSVLPISEALEMTAGRQALRRTLSSAGWPYLAMRLGIPDDRQPEPQHTPRLPSDQTVEITQSP